MKRSTTDDAFGLVSPTRRMQALLQALTAAHADTDMARYHTTWAVCFTDLTDFSRRPWVVSLQRLLQFEQALQAMLLAHEGRLIKSMGDSHLLLFPQVAPALRGLRALQQSLPLIPFCVGIGYGALLLCAHAQGRRDIFGPEVNRASRLGEDIASGWQLLLTDAAYANLPPMEQRQCVPLVRHEMPCWEAIAPAGDQA